MRALAVVALAMAIAPTGACKEGPPKLEGPAILPPSASVSTAPPPVAPKTEAPSDKFPMSDEEIARVVNPSNATDWTGPTGAIEGVVRVHGDPPAMRSFMKLPDGCEDAPAVHGPHYRAGAKGELADALVAVIKVAGYVRPSREDKVVTIQRCAMDPTVIDLSLGQRLMIANADKMPYMPQLPGKVSVHRLALKDQSPVPLNLTQPGAFGLTWLAGALPGTDVPTATVFVIPSALHMVTGIDGKFRITGVPAGKARVTVSHLFMGEVSKEIDVKPGSSQSIELTMTYKAPSAAPAAKPSGSVKPLQ